MNPKKVMMKINKLNKTVKNSIMKIRKMMDNNMMTVRMTNTKAMIFLTDSRVSEKLIYKTIINS